MTGMQKLLAALGCMALAGCAGPPKVDVAAGTKPFVLERFFAGHTVGQGSFDSSIAGVHRELKVATSGRWNGKVLTLTEHIAYADGAREVKTWHITRTGPGTYVGTRDDVIGTATIRQEGPNVTMQYTADVKGTDGSVSRLGFADTLSPDGAGRMLNTSTVSKFGVPVGTVKIAFAKRR